MVGKAGLEPARSFEHMILNPIRTVLQGAPKYGSLGLGLDFVRYCPPVCRCVAVNIDVKLFETGSRTGRLQSAIQSLSRSCSAPSQFRALQGDSNFNDFHDHAGFPNAKACSMDRRYLTVCPSRIQFMFEICPQPSEGANPVGQIPAYQDYVVW